MASMSTVPTTPSVNALEHLPVEIQAHILSALNNVTSLRSLIRASPQFLQVYQKVRETTISSILSHLRSGRRSRSEVFEFLERFKHSPATLQQHHEFSLDISRKLLQTQSVVEYLVKQFIINRLDHMSAKVPPSTTEKYGLLKTPGIEHHRLARAFYHLELYGILFYDPDNDEDVITVTEQANFFRVKLRDWELEEFLCVREYLLEELSHYLNKIEDDFLQEYINDGPPADIATKPFDMRFCHEDEDWYFFSDDGQLASIQNRWREVTLTRGLKTLHTIFQSRTPEQRENILGNIEIDRPRNTMNQTLEGHFSTRYRAGPHQTVIDVLPRSGNSLDEFNHAWLWTSRYWSFQLKRGNTSHENHSYIHEPPRRWGYVIWSNETLKILGVLEKPKSTDWTCEGGVLKTLLQSR